MNLPSRKQHFKNYREELKKTSSLVKTIKKTRKEYLKLRDKLTGYLEDFEKEFNDFKTYVENETIIKEKVNSAKPKSSNDDFITKQIANLETVKQKNKLDGEMIYEQKFLPLLHDAKIDAIQNIVETELSKLRGE
ncbi:hypothetical protein ACWXVT_02505 [Mycoplasma sp. 1573]